MTKYYNANQVHKYGYRSQFMMPSKEESIEILYGIYLAT